MNQNPDFVNARKPAFANKSSKRHCTFFANAAMKTRASDDHLFTPWKSASPHSSVIFPSKDAVLREVGREHCPPGRKPESELSVKATTDATFTRFYRKLWENVTEVGRPLWQAVILAGRWTRFVRPNCEGRKPQPSACSREIIAEGQKNGEITCDFPVVHLAEFMEGLFNTSCVNGPWILLDPHKLTERVRKRSNSSCVEPNLSETFAPPRRFKRPQSIR